jgi:membrane protein DedA with SNARE-associated domain
MFAMKTALIAAAIAIVVGMAFRFWHQEAALSSEEYTILIALLVIAVLLAGACWKRWRRK